MLGALFTFILIAIIRWYVELMKKFKKFIQTGTEFSMKQLVCLLFTNFLVIGFAFCVILIPLSDFLDCDEEIWTIFSMVISLLIAVTGDYFIYRKYATLQLKNKKMSAQNNSLDKENIDCTSSKQKMSLYEEISILSQMKSSQKKCDPVQLVFNILLGLIGFSALTVSIIFFAECMSYSFRRFTASIVLWLITSLAASGAVCVWYYLNKSHISKTANKILGLVFFILGIAGCVSPFFSVASLYVAAMSLKNIFNYSEDEDIIILTDSATTNEWSLRDFVKTHGPKIKLASLSHKGSGEEFKAVMVGDDGNWIIIKFSNSIPVLTAKEVAQQANELKVVLFDTGEYYLRRAGENYKRISINGINYQLDYTTNTAKVIRTEYDMYSRNADIPPHVVHDSIFFNVISIERHAFTDHSFLNTITISNRISNIDKDAFNGDFFLQSIVVENGNARYDSRENCNAIIETATNTLIRGCGKTIIPNSVKTIGCYAFCECKSLNSIIIPNGITCIDNGAFAGCDNLTSIILPNSITNIGDGAFCGCWSISSIILPDGVVKIGDSMFLDCWNLTSINIPNNITSIGEDAFRGCSSLTTVTIPNSVMTIGEHAFDGCLKLNNIDIHYGITQIGKNAFSECGIESIIIPDSVVEIGDNVFWDCSVLTSVVLPRNLTKIGNDIFEYCKSLQLIKVPKEKKEEYCNLGLENYRNLIVEI